MPKPHFPQPIRELPPFEGPFDAFRLATEGCDVLFASYPAGTEIPPHSHETENCGVVTQGELILIRGEREERLRPGDWYHLAAGETHAARFEVATSEVELWFRRVSAMEPRLSFEAVAELYERARPGLLLAHRDA